MVATSQPALMFNGPVKLLLALVRNTLKRPFKVSPPAPLIAPPKVKVLLWLDVKPWGMVSWLESTTALPMYTGLELSTNLGSKPVLLVIKTNPLPVREVLPTLKIS